MRRFSLIGLVLAGALLVPLFPASRAQQQRTVPVTPTANASRASVTLSPATLEAAKRVTAEQLKTDLYYVASDEMQGRDTPSPGLDMTAQYIADRLKSLKLKPAGDPGSYFQTIKMRSENVDPSKTGAALRGRAYNFGQDFLVAPATGRAAGSLVYAGHGWVVPSKKIDAYRGIDVRDKIVIVSAGLPADVTLVDIAANGKDWDDPASYALKHGATGIIMIPHAKNFDRWWLARRLSLQRNRFEVVGLDASAAGDDDNDEFADQQPLTARIPTIMPSRAMLDEIFAGERITGKQIFERVAGVPLPDGFDLAPGKRMSFTVGASSVTATTQNVIGVVEGEDPLLKNEYVAIGAHYDHVGVGRAVKGDAIYNGADDDGSGTVAMLALAEAFARGARPKRSILFVWHTGEEKGLWGSEYFIKYPTVPLDKIITQLNIDMIGRSKQRGDINPFNRDLSGPNEIYVIGSKMMSAELGALSAGVNAAYLNLSFNYRFDDPADPNRFFYRSDHYNYALRGIPIIFYFDGAHEDYHQPSDTADKIDYQKMEAVTRTIFVTASELANRATRPAIDRPLNARAVAGVH